MFVSLYLSIYLSLYIYIYIYIYTHTHTHSTESIFSLALKDEFIVDKTMVFVVICVGHHFGMVYIFQASLLH